MKTAVNIIRAHSYERTALRHSLETLLQPLGGIGAIVKSGDRVLLKPNLIVAGRPSQAIATNPDLVYCVAQMVQEAGGQPFLGDSPAMGSVQGVAKANGLLPIAQELKLPIVEFYGQHYSSISDSFDRLWLSKEAMGADVIVNLPKVKSHQQLTLTLGVKNLFGCVPGKVKVRWHWLIGKDPNRFGEMLVETARLLAPELTILDGIIAHQGNGPTRGEPRFLGLLAATCNVFALDRAFAEILKVDPLTVPTIAASLRLGLCPKLEAIDFPTLKPEDCQVEDWQLATRSVPIYFSLPRVVLSTLKDWSIRRIQEPVSSYLKR
jgi:uncharacterized protein (DUF362 family)